ncbi:tetratricopeptide (TPR) repeat protein [Alkalibacillus filiformis]|uniref:Tetratricopeptide (TPR) repeat protein n=1 Tax=Alkalibacillus filiformis TaxID=200990 RepID=A0ABU0DQX7_9BACI|nr:tetratricopeptide repeat protein [Alkalibacillus filiformis]MDQ0350852.1 tetratricopeptide (TPR) repeat protein [Alkalibacillus filiformis]
METIGEALKLKEEGKINEAVQLLKSYVAEAEDAERFDIAQLLQEWGLLNDARDVYEDMLLLYPDDDQIRLLLAEIYTDLGEDELVLETLGEIKEDSDFYTTALVLLADFYQSQGLFEVAEQKLKEAKSIDSEEPIIDLALAELAFSNGEYQKSIPFYKKVDKEAPSIDVVNIKERLAEALSSVGDWEEALNYFELIELETPDQLFKYGYTAYQIERFDICTKVWNQLIDLDPEYTSVYPMLARAFYEDGALQEAFDTTVQGINKDEHNNELYLLAAQYALKLNKQEEAVTYLQEALAIDPAYEDGVELLLNIYFENEQYEQAKDLVDQLMGYEGYPVVLNWRAAQIYNELEEFDLSKSHFEQAALTYSEDPNFLKEYGMFLVEEGDLHKALDILNAYLKVIPDDEEVREFMLRMKEQ